MTQPTLLVFPAYDDNPYLRMLLTSVRDAGWQVRPVIPLREFEAAAAALGEGDAVLLGWTAQISQSARTPWGAARNVRRFLAALDAARARGARVLWTIHNAVAHDARNAEQDARLQQEIANRADRIHVMNRGTAELVDFSLPAGRVRRLPHPSYLGVHSDPPPSDDARERLGVEPGTLAVLMLGHMKPYKGVLDLVAAAKESDRPVTLLLAGAGDWRAIDAQAEGVRLIVYRDYVPEEDVPLWFAAANVAVLPYRRILNSGSAMLAATFGVPVVLPDEPSVLAEYGGQPWVVTYDRDRPVAGIQGVLQDVSLDWAAKGERAFAFAKSVHPRDVAAEFLDLLRETVG